MLLMQRNWTLYVVRNFQACISALWTGLEENCKHLVYENWGSDEILHLTLWCMCIFRPGNGRRNKTVVSVSWKLAWLFKYHMKVRKTTAHFTETQRGRKYNFLIFPVNHYVWMHLHWRCGTWEGLFLGVNLTWVYIRSTAVCISVQHWSFWSSLPSSIVFRVSCGV